MSHHAPASALARRAALAALVVFTACSKSVPSTDDPHTYSLQISEANTAFEAQEYEEAIAAYTNVLNYHAESAETYYRRGLAHLESGFPDTAIFDFDASLRRRPDFADAYLARGKAYILLDHPTRAIRDCTRAIRSRTGFAEAHYWRGRAYHENRMPERAVVDLREAIRLDEGLAAQIHPLLGEACWEWSFELRKEGRADEAAEAEMQARRLNPDYAIARVTPQERTDPLAAEGRSGPQTTLKPVQFEELYRQGMTALEAQDFDEAILKFTATLNASPRHVGAYVGRGEAFYQKGFPDTALADLGQAILYDRTNANAHCQRARAHAALGNEVLAIRDCTEAIRWNATLGDAYRIRAESYIRDGQLDRARIDIDEATRLNVPDTDRLLEMLAKGYQEQGLRHLAMRSLDEAHAGWTQLQVLAPDLAVEFRGKLAQAFYDRAMKSLGRFDLLSAESDLAVLAPLNASLARELKIRLAREFYQRGQERNGAGDREAAALDFSRARELGYRDS